jgi:hypothetical protein
MRIASRLTANRFIRWLQTDVSIEETRFPMCDFARIQYELRPCDILLLEGRSRISNIIRLITQSPWTHAALYIGRLYEIDNAHTRARIKAFYHCEPNEQLLIESILGQGTIIVPVTKYKPFHIRLCRPKGLSLIDAQRLIDHAVSHLGRTYDIRHNVDLARFLLPWSFMPKKWRSSLFEQHTGTATKEICSSMIAEAFDSVNFPILPIMRQNQQQQITISSRNPKLFTPSDFDYSPFFDIIKYPLFQLEEPGIYHHLPWQERPSSSPHQSSKEDAT